MAVPLPRIAAGGGRIGKRPAPGAVAVKASQLRANSASPYNGAAYLDGAVYRPFFIAR